MKYDKTHQSLAAYFTNEWSLARRSAIVSIKIKKQYSLKHILINNNIGAIENDPMNAIYGSYFCLTSGGTKVTCHATIKNNNLKLVKYYIHI